MMPKRYNENNMTGPDLNYYCSYCGRLFRLKWQLTAHIRVHEKRTPYICHICPASFVRNSDLKNHLKCHSNERPYNCKYCSKAFKTKFSKECHEDTHGVNTYKCSVCEESFSTYMKLNRHKKRHKKSVVIKKNGQVHYSCAFCSSFFLSLEFKKHHEETVHHKTEGDKDDLSIQASKCPICFKKFANGKEYRSHVYEVHPSDAENVFYTKCTICNKRVSAAFYSYHMMAHNGIKPHACSVCDIKFTRKHDLLRHMDIHSEETPFKCDKCPKKFKCKKNLNMHLKSHLKKDQFCDMCNKAFATREKLSNHRNRIHLRDQNLEKCTLCEKDILNQYMSRHMKEFHCHEEKLCDYCGQTFRNAFKLRIHITRYCKETETYKAKALYQQQVRSHSSTDLECSYKICDSLFYGYIKECFLCGFTFSQKRAFNIHLQAHEYTNWKMSWNAKNVYRRKRTKSKGSNVSNNIQEIYVVKDVKKNRNLLRNDILNEILTETVITKYEYKTEVTKEFSWVHLHTNDKKKSNHTGQEVSSAAELLHSGGKAAASKPVLLNCTKCLQPNKIQEADPNRLLIVFACEHCSTVNECVNSAGNLANGISNSSLNTSIPLNTGLTNFNTGTTNILPLIILATPVQQNESGKENLGNVDPNEIKVEEPEIIIDENPVSHPAVQKTKDTLEGIAEAKSEADADEPSDLEGVNDISPKFTEEETEVSLLPQQSSETVKDKEEILKAMKGKQFISIDDLRKLRDCNINTILDYL